MRTRCCCSFVSRCPKQSSRPAGRQPRRPHEEHGSPNRTAVLNQCALTTQRVHTKELECISTRCCCSLVSWCLMKSSRPDRRQPSRPHEEHTWTNRTALVNKCAHNSQSVHATLLECTSTCSCCPVVSRCRMQSSRRRRRQPRWPHGQHAWPSRTAVVNLCAQGTQSVHTTLLECRSTCSCCPVVSCCPMQSSRRRCRQPRWPHGQHAWPSRHAGAPTRVHRSQRVHATLLECPSVGAASSVVCWCRVLRLRASRVRQSSMAVACTGQADTSNSSTGSTEHMRESQCGPCIGVRCRRLLSSRCCCCCAALPLALTTVVGSAAAPPLVDRRRPPSHTLLLRAVHRPVSLGLAWYRLSEPSTLARGQWGAAVEGPGQPSRARARHAAERKRAGASTSR